MKSFTVATIAAIAAPALGQIAGIPDCATQPAIAALQNSGCRLDDYACICGNQAFISSLVPQIQAACTPEEAQTTLTAAQAFCAAQGVPLVIPSLSTTTTSATTTSTTPATSSPPVTTTTYSAPAVTSKVASYGASGYSAVPTYGTNGTHAYPTSSVPVYTGAAPTSSLDKVMGLVAAGVVAALL